MTHEQLRALCLAATTEHERTKEGFDKYRAANRALRRETYPANILALLDDIDRLRGLLRGAEAIIGEGDQSVDARAWLKAFDKEIEK